MPPRQRILKFECHLCEYKGMYHFSLRNHLRNEHAKPTCRFCWKEFTHAGNLTRHIRQNHKTDSSDSDSVDSDDEYSCWLNGIDKISGKILLL